MASPKANGGITGYSLDQLGTCLGLEWQVNCVYVLSSVHQLKVGDG